VPLRIHTSNRMEKLVDGLAELVSEPLSSPFVPETIVVQSKGMQRWLAMELAKRFGVWANGDYPFPNAMVWKLFASALPDIPDRNAFAPEIMHWKIMELLPGFLQEEAFAQLRNYLAGDRDGLKIFQLSVKIADAFDQYSLFRPEMLLQWEEGRGDDWQAVLWRELVAHGKGEHRGRLKEAFCRLMQGEERQRAGLPERISVFGVSYLPQYHLDVLAAAARSTEINLFLLSPTGEYWGDIVSSRQQARMTFRQRQLRFEGNPLLASLGRLGRDFSDMIIDLGEVVIAQEDRYQDPGHRILLHQVQSDILNLREQEQGAATVPIKPDDRSIQIHSCHSPLREVEVLHDQLLALLEEYEGLAPRDIVVMTPDIETYAPYITTVFEGCQDPARRIPFSIADRSLTSEGEIAAAVMKILALPGSRLTAVQLFDLLEAAPIKRRFALDSNDLDIIRRWLEETRVRWGMDEQDRIRLGLPGYAENSWKSGLDRLLLGYAMPVEGVKVFHGTLPFDEMEGSAASILGNLAEFVHKVAAVAESLARPRPLADWRDSLRGILADFIAADDDSARELAVVAAVVESLGDVQALAGYGQQVSFAVLSSWLAAKLQQQERGLGFMTGGVTFCAMLPMRSIPFRVIALIGMSEGAFPRQSRSPGFDLMARHPRRGDRSLRDEDRYLFLESILSARDCLYLSYVGQSIRDNSEIPPSVLVSEFLEAIGLSLPAGGDGIADRLLTRHRLQPFSKEYFLADSPLFSYSAENGAAFSERHQQPKESGPFLERPLAPPADELKDIPLHRLLRFFDNPAKFFLETRLGIRPEQAVAPLDEREPFLLEGLDAYTLKMELLEIVLAGGNAADFLPVARCRGILPPARHGESVFAGALLAVQAFARTVQEKIGRASALPPVDFQLGMAGFRISGRLDHLWPQGLIRYRCAKLKAKDQIRTWIEHLVLNALEQPELPRESTLLMVDGTRSFVPMEGAASCLETLLHLYWQGLSQPLRFFPVSAMAYAGQQDGRLDRARKAWEGGFHSAGEGEDASFRLCFGQGDPLDGEFEAIARAILEPLLQYQHQ
jgi:exodeoxyribonuclease V gamma subunit